MKEIIIVCPGPGWGSEEGEVRLEIPLWGDFIRLSLAQETQCIEEHYGVKWYGERDDRGVRVFRAVDPLVETLREKFGT